MNRTILINVTTGQQVEMNGKPSQLLMPKKAQSVTSSTDQSNSSFDLGDFDENDLKDIELIEGSLTGDTSTSEPEIKKKRQRLTHLTVEEKCMRRKLKNRVAAQSARDRKKVKCDSLEDEIEQLKSVNETLKSENALLKDKARQLINENRKLLEFKMSQEKQIMNVITTQVVHDFEPQTVISSFDVQPIPTSSLKRKLASDPADQLTNDIVLLEAEESAAFSAYVSQPKSQLQVKAHRQSALLPRSLGRAQLIYALIVYTLNLIRMETTHNTSKTTLQGQTPSTRQSKLRETLLKLLRLFKNQHQQGEKKLLEQKVHCPSRMPPSNQTKALKLCQQVASVNSTLTSPSSPSAIHLAMIMSLVINFLQSSKYKTRSKPT